MKRSPEQPRGTRVFLLVTRILDACETSAPLRMSTVLRSPSPLFRRLLAVCNKSGQKVRQTVDAVSLHLLDVYSNHTFA